MRYICTAAVATFVLAGTSFAATINVPSDYATIQGAIDASSNGDVINIAAGTYNETNLNPGGRAITIQGTFNGDGSLATTIDAQQGSSVFVIESGETYGTVIKDLVITGGAASYGGGILCSNSNATINNCWIKNNWATWHGGGIFCRNSSPMITGSIIKQNGTSNDGSGIYCENKSNPTINNCTITGNEGKWGGGIYSREHCNPTISGCTIEGNTANYGGGIYSYVHSSPTITGCIISENTASLEGGGVYCQSGNPTITDCTISGNEAENNGGGICGFDSNPSIADCVISGNTALRGGGAYCKNSNSTITGCIISDNTASSEGGGIYQYDDESFNSILSDTAVCGNDPDQIYGTWTEDGDNTVQDICPTGACCSSFEDFCVPGVLEVACLQWGGQWLGEATSCDDCTPQVEPEVLGACCINGACVPTTLDGCYSASGTYAGDEVDCSDANCPTNCAGDVVPDGVIDINDVLFILSKFGNICP